METTVESSIESKPALDAYKKAERDRFDGSAPAHADPAGALGPNGALAMSPALRSPYLHVERWLADVAPGRVILDFGSGRGIHSITPAALGATVVGVDISPRSSGIAAMRALRDGVADRCHFTVGDCERLPFADASFDLILSMGTFCSLRLEPALAELARVIRPDGKVVIADTLGHNPLLNLNRKLHYWRNRRTRWEVEHILKLSDLERIRSRFRHSEIEFFDATTPYLATVCRGEGRLANGLIRLAQGVDRHLFRFSLLRPLAFKFVCTLSGPLPAGQR